MVTGGARGIGAATAVALARRGITPVIAVRNAKSGQPTAEAVRAHGAECGIEECDVAEYEQVRRCVAHVLETWGRLDIVVNNAAQIEPIGHVSDTEPLEWARAVSVNLIGQDAPSAKVYIAALKPACASS